MLISDWSSDVCSSDLAETTTTVEATTTTEPELSEEEAVVKAYVEHWPAFYAFLNGTPPGDPADYFTGDRLADLPGSIAQFAEQGLEVRGEPQLKPGQIGRASSRERACTYV